MHALKLLTPLLLGLAIMPNAYSQAPILMEACNGLPDPTKRLECFKAAAGTPSEKGSLAQLKETVIGVQSGLKTNITYPQFESLYLEYSRQVALYKSKRPADEITALLDEASAAYEDSKTFWIKSNSYVSPERQLLSLSDLRTLGMASFVQKYSIPITDLNWVKWVGRWNTLNAMWSYAQAKTTEALNLAEGK